MGLFLSSGRFWFFAGSLFGAGKAVLHPVACDPVPGARGRGQGTETLAELGGLQAPGLMITSASRKRLPWGRFVSDMSDVSVKERGCS